MRRAIGLRSEIVIQLTLLMAAAILFATLLLLTYSEQEMLDRTIKHNHATINLLIELSAAPIQSDLFYTQIQAAHKNLLNFAPLEMLTVADNFGTPIYLRPAATPNFPDQRAVLSVARGRQPIIDVNYTSSLLSLFSAPPKNSLVITLPVYRQGLIEGVIQAKFSLGDIRTSILKAQKFVLWFILLYGLVLVIFGSYLLNKSIIKPILNLQTSARKIAAGNLATQIAPTGPYEVNALGIDLNDMRMALFNSQQQTKLQIDKLKNLNQELQQTRDELIQSAKMASIGHLAAGMAHEVGNPLGALTGYLALLEDETNSRPVKEIISAASNETARIDRLVRDLLNYARPERGSGESVNCIDILHASVNILLQQGRLCESQLKIDHPKTVPLVSIAANRLQQVIINLVQNALDAAPENSLIALQINYTDEIVSISIANQGPPIPAKQLTALFDPFYTTKSPDKGRGLGLFVCHSIVSDANGQIEVTSTPDGQTCFTVKLPPSKETGKPS